MTSSNFVKEESRYKSKVGEGETKFIGWSSRIIKDFYNVFAWFAYFAWRIVPHYINFKPPAFYLFFRIWNGDLETANFTMFLFVFHCVILDF